jgi:hypothetical protein
MPIRKELEIDMAIICPICTSLIELEKIIAIL